MRPSGQPGNNSSNPQSSATPEWSFDADALNAAALGLLTDDQPDPVQAAERKATLDRNLQAIAQRSPRVAKRIEEARPRPDLVFADTKDGVPSATIVGASGLVALASKRRPLAEAHTIASSIDIEQHGGIVVLGFGLGYHAQAIAQRTDRLSAVIIFEPDVELLRAVLERIDHSEWIRSGVVCFLTDEDASGEMSEAARGLEAPLSIGIELIEHTPSRERLGDRAARFGNTFAEIVSALRTQVITTLMQSDITLRNLLLNADHYATRPGIADLKNAAQGRAAVIVSAGPSLERNLHRLSDPAVRERVVVIAVQTVLRPMLTMGIRPDFVTALDYHEISTRFYEGLTADDVRGITLIAEPKVNPAVLDAFPGDIRLVHDEVLESLFGPTRTADDILTPGATVAHLAYFLARHLGCDPAILIGQDLGFTDGQYYASGAAIHEVWAPELNPFRTIEMFEWERIARGKSKLIQRKDHLGRPIYTDEQMATYLAQFEREFAADSEKGLLTLDCTEGGVTKRGTQPLALAEALSRHAARSLDAIRLPQTAPASPERAQNLREVLRKITKDSRAIARNSRETQKLLSRIADLHAEPNSTDRINALVHQIHAIRDDVESRVPAYPLVQRLNQTGTFQRFKADRLLKLNPPTTPVEQQKRQVERDALNVGWVAQMADLLEQLSTDALSALDGAPKRTRPRPVREDSSINGPARTTRTIAILTDRGAAQTALRETIQRLQTVSELAAVTILSDNPDRTAEAIGAAGNAPKPQIVGLPSDPIDSAWHRRIATARAWAPSCWRGGLGGATCYDSVLHPEPALTILQQHEADAAIVLDASWSSFSPALASQIIERFAESPDERAIVFSQASPGHAPCLISREGLERLLDMRCRASHFATIGGILSYVPAAAASDPIAAESCIKIDPALRDAPPSIASQPPQLTIELTAQPTNSRGGQRRMWWPEIETGQPASIESIRKIISSVYTDAPIAITIASRGGASVMGDPIRHPQFAEIMRTLRTDPRIGWIHLRTDLAGEIDPPLLDAVASADVISIDLLAQTEATYAILSGHDCTLQSVLENAQRLHERFQRDRIEGPLGIKAPAERWIIPRITRCDATYDEIEGFYDHWVSLLGHAIIDPLPRSIDGQRIAPLRVPTLAQQRAQDQQVFDALGRRV